MNKTLLASGMALALGATGSANAITALTDGDYVMQITGGCFDFGNCQTSGAGTLTDNTTANQASIGGFGSGIVGDGVMGVIGFTLTGGNYSVTSYSQDSYLGTTGGTFYLQDQDGLGAAMGGTIDNTTGAMTFDPTGRDGIAAKFAGSLGLQPWNVDNGSDGGGSGLWDTFTTGTSTNRNQGPFTPGFTLTGSDLVDGDPNTWTGKLVSAGNIGSAWGDFDMTQYSEVYDITITGEGAPPIPIPAAVWLFGSGLVGLVGVARRRKRA